MNSIDRIIDEFIGYCSTRNITYKFCDDPHHLTSPLPNQLMLFFPNSDTPTNIIKVSRFAVNDNPIVRLSEAIYLRQITLDDLQDKLVLKQRELKLNSLLQ